MPIPASILALEDLKRLPVGKGSCYDRVHACRAVQHGGLNFLVAVYGAFNAFGLIGPEKNGIVVVGLNEEGILLDEHAISGSGGTFERPTALQLKEFERIVALDKAAFTRFVNTHPRNRLRIFHEPTRLAEPKVFDASAFSDTEFDSAGDKARALTALVAFACDGFEKELWTESLYATLHLHLGHIAHYSAAVFYETWFSSAGRRIEFFDRHVDAPCFGPWGDVSRAFRDWLVGAAGRKLYKALWGNTDGTQAPEGVVLQGSGNREAKGSPAGQG